MKQLVIISGKGGTGKTTVTASLASLAGNAVLADCDVDAADLHILLQPYTILEHPFISGKIVTKNMSLCSGCGLCISVCRFDAHTQTGINPYDCEGCGLCARICPENAIEMRDKTCGSWFISDTKYGKFIHARLHPGEENSGKLVTCVRKAAINMAEKESADIILIDGPPGIGCPLIASISSCTGALIVTEPTVAGIHDMKRILEVTAHFNVPCSICINKWDINPDNTADIEAFAAQNNIPVSGKIPFETCVIDSLAAKKTVVEYTDNHISQQIRFLWQQIKTIFSIN